MHTSPFPNFESSWKLFVRILRKSWKIVRPNFESSWKNIRPNFEKEFLKYLAVRGVTLYAQEHRTSVTCPCGTSKLVNIEPRSRFRCHQTLSTAPGKMETCPLACIDVAKPNEYDRDELATWNVLHVLQHALKGEEWPEHLKKNDESNMTPSAVRKLLMTVQIVLKHPVS